ncbi:MAG: hypothetical protein Ct9H300mP19_20520 [Dehalococcoidia bacterium]|nr:MAG: hypothetical protein Ct9H300mP19_20520 [Dehalococcoidia bacterium]
MTTQSDTTDGTVARWYIVHTYSGQEDRVQKNLEQRVSTMDVKDKILNVVVPTEEEVEISEGERKTVQKKMYAGYLIVQMVMDEESWYVVRNTPGVTGFISAEDEREKRPKPIPLEDSEVDRIMSRMTSEAPRVRVAMSPESLFASKMVLSLTLWARWMRCLQIAVKCVCTFPFSGVKRRLNSTFFRLRSHSY